jgi:glycosyltransferase involved in cell wall biosynthesis
MRILHVPYSFFPDPPGGTEIYVDSLAAWQRTLGMDAAVAAPAAGSAKYERSGLPVWRFAASSHVSLRELYGEGEPAAAEEFGRIVDEFHPDVVHLHAMTSAISVRLADEVKRRGVPIVFNYHTPTVSCPRGSLKRFGTEICDGRQDARTCSVCTVMARGASKPIASLVQMLAPVAGPAVRGLGLSGGIWTAMQIPELSTLRVEKFHSMMKKVDRVVALCKWTRELLLLNDVPESKLSLCRQGINWEPANTGSRHRTELPLRLAFLGRFDPTKGTDIVVRAVREADLPLELDLYGVRQGDSGDRYASEVRTLIGDDPRIRLLPPLPQSEVIPALRNYDALVVPSQWLETGPLVVLEAFAAGTPVIGSDLGGIAELVTNSKDGLLVSPYASVAAWAAAFQRICADPAHLDSWRANIQPPRHTKQVALEFIPLYEQLVRH